MNDEESKKLVKLAVGLFPTLTKDQQQNLGRHLLDYELKPAAAIVRTHGITYEYMNFPQLFNALKADKARRRLFREDRAKERTVDGLRRLGRTEWGIQSYITMDDQSVILNHYAKCWETVRDSGVKKEGANCARAMIFAFAKIALIEIGKPEKEALEIAQMIVEVSPGEKIMRREILKSVIGNEVIDKDQSIRDLAIAALSPQEAA